MSCSVPQTSFIQVKDATCVALSDVKNKEHAGIKIEIFKKERQVYFFRNLRNKFEQNARNSKQDTKFYEWIMNQ